MTRRTLWIVLLATLVTVAACSSPESSTDPEAASTQDASGTGGDQGDGKKKGREGHGEHDNGSEKKNDGSGSGTGGETDGSEGMDGSEGSDGLTEGSNEDDGSSAAYPAPGSYTFSQEGYEEFCQAANCEREQLPPRQPVSIATEQEGPDGAVVVMEIRAGNRVFRTTTRFNREHALITKAYVRVAYSGFTFEETYSPRPPVDSLRFPITAGES